MALSVAFVTPNVLAASEEHSVAIEDGSRVKSTGGGEGRLGGCQAVRK